MSLDPKHKQENEILSTPIQDRYGNLVKTYQEDETASALEMGGTVPEGNKSDEDREKTIAEHLYPSENLATLPDSVKDVSLCCGNPLAIASLQKGEHVLDLGSGGSL